jgi:replicative DNA helicase
VALLADEGAPFDVVTVGEALERRGLLADVGGIEYLTGLDLAAASAANLSRYARVIRDASTRRALIRTAGELAEMARNPEGRSAAELQAAAESKVFALADNRSAAASSAADMACAFVERLDRRSSGEDMGRVPTGLSDLDRHLIALAPGNLVVVGARPSVGKTALALTIARNAIGRHPVLLFSLEMGADEIADRLVSMLARVPLHRIITGELHPPDWHSVNDAVGRIRDAALDVDETAASVPEIRARARRWRRQHDGPALIIIDYLQLLDGPGETRNLAISAMTRSLKRMARETQAPVLLLSQLNRNAAHEKPSIAELRDSGAIEQDADAVLLLNRPELYSEIAERGIAEIIIGKQRNGPANLAIRTMFHEQTATFHNLARQQAAA